MEATRVTVDEAKERMDRGEPLAFVDTRNPQAWGASDVKLPGATEMVRMLFLSGAEGYGLRPARQCRPPVIFSVGAAQYQAEASPRVAVRRQL